MKTTCLLCPEPATIRHHVAGEANDPDLVTHLCARHAVRADRALPVLGVRLRHNGEHHPAEIVYARCAGVAALLSFAVGPDPRIGWSLRDVAREAGSILGVHVGPNPSETGPLPSVPAVGWCSPGLLALMGAGPHADPCRAFERYCRRTMREAGP